MIDGNWKIVVNSPVGVQEGAFQFRTEGRVLKGTSQGPEGFKEVKDGTVDGDSVTWKVDIKKPITTTLSFSGKVDGDALAGKVKAGLIGPFSFSGVRIKD